MATTQLTKEIQNKFNLNHVYARNVVYSLSNIKNIKKFGLYLLVLGLVLVGGFSTSVFKTKAAADITITSAKITAPNEVTIVFDTGGDNLGTAPITAYGIANDGVASLTLASGGPARNLSGVVITPTTFTAVYTFTGAPATTDDTGSLAVHAPDAILDTNTIPDSLDHSIVSIPLTDGQAPTLLSAAYIVVDNSQQPNKIILTFNEPLEPVQAATAGNYLVTNGTITYTIASAVLSGGNTIVTLTLATVNPADPSTFITNTDATTGIKVTPSAANIKDVALNPYAAGEITAAGATNFLDSTRATVNATLVKNSSTTFTVSFSEKLDKTTAETLNKYTLGGTCLASTGNPSAAVLQASGKDVLLTTPDTSGCAGGQTVIVTPASTITDVSGFAITSSVATNILSLTPITFRAGTDTKDYDGGFTSTGTPTVTSGSYNGDDYLFSSTQTFSDQNAGIGDRTLSITPASIVIKSLGSGDDHTANYTITLNPFITGTINKKQLTHDTPTITLSKQYDGDNTAVITGAGTLGGKVGSEDVSVTEVATYNDASVATGKTITIAYTLAGADQGNYLKPVDDTTTVTGVISRRPSSSGYYRPIPVVIVPITLNPATITNDDISIIVPKLPKTGFPPKEKSTMFPIFAFAGVYAISIFLYFVFSISSNQIDKHFE